MATTDELIMKINGEDYHEDLQFIIDENLRTIAIPKDGVVLGVCGDKDINRVNFRMNRYYNGFDLSEFNIRVNYINANDEPNYFVVTDIQVDVDYIIFTWLVDAYATRYVGEVRFCVRLFTESEGKIDSQFFSTIGKVSILEGIEVESMIPEAEVYDLITRISSDVEDKIQTKADAAIASIPADYTTLSNDVSELKGDLVDLENEFDFSYQHLTNSEWISGQLYFDNGTIWGGMDGWYRYPKIIIKKGTYKITACNENYTWNNAFTGVITSDGTVTLLKNLSSYSIGSIYDTFSIDRDMTIFISKNNTKDIMLVNGEYPLIYTEGYIDLISKKAKEEFEKGVNANNVHINNPIIKNIDDVNLGITATKTNEVITQTHSGSGNDWMGLGFIPASIKNNFVRLKFNISSISGTLSLQLSVTKKSDSSTKYIPIKAINENGEYSFDFDLNYYSVYEDVDISKNIIVLFVNATSEFTCVYTSIDLYSIETSLDTSKNLLEHLDVMNNNIESNKNAISAIKSSSGEMTSPNGSKFILQVSDNGEFVSVPKLPSKILYIGNSLLVGFGFGMAASNSSEDYYYKVNSYLEGKGKTLTKDKISGTGYEGTTSESEQDEWLTNTLLSHLNNELELVIIQLGDNVNTTERISALENGSKKLIRYIRQNAIKARVAWVAEWYSNSIKQTYISNACAECGATFIDISDLPNVSGNQANVGDVITRDDGTTFTIDNTGVASHPSSQGMTAIANRIIETLFE